MRLRSVRASSLSQLNERARAFVAACGYEDRSSAVSRFVTGPERRVALGFAEWPDALARQKNEREFVERGFKIHSVGGNEPRKVQEIIYSVANSVFPNGNAIAFDISSMTRAWHGAIIRELRAMDTNHEVETFFAYVPAIFNKPETQSMPNEFVAPVDGFAALRPPDLPIAAVIGLGYERGRALGLQ